jgi:hypothetical protein
MCSEKKKKKRKDNYMHYARHTHTQKLKRSMIIIAKIYMQHKEPVIGDFCCRVNFPLVFFSGAEHIDKRIYEKKSNKCAQMTTSKLNKEEE